MPPREAIANLKEQVTQTLNGKIREADLLIDVLTPIYESAEKSEELEIAYIIRGQKNIINRLNALVETARKEVTIFISHPAVFKELKESLLLAKEKHRVKLNIAATQEVLEREDFSDFDETRLLRCSVGGMLISDMNTLLTLSDWFDEVATLTQDQNLIRVCRDYYDNPACCTNVH
jgi:sugar-specific transcriptional regulator TrmB